MGRIIFATRDTGDFERFGRDLRGTTDGLGAAVMNDEISDFNNEFWAPVLGCRPDQVGETKRYFGRGFGNDKFRLPDGKTTDAADVAANTLKAIASDAVKLLIHIHLQCEVHAWVSEEDRPWFVKLLAEAMEKRIIGEDEKLLTFLDETARGPIVMSYSVCETFPDLYRIKTRLFDEANVPEEERDEACVYEVSDKLGWTDEQRWDACFEELSTRKMQLTPRRVSNGYFGDMLTIYDVERLWREHNAKTAPKEEITNPILKALAGKKEQ